MMTSWRANCDVQLLLYNCDPDKPVPSEIARVTDYCVAYCSKGNVALQEEKNQYKAIALQAIDETGSKQELKKLAQHILNKAASS